MEKELDEIKSIRKQQIFNEYNDLIEWLMLLYGNPRYRVVDEQTKSVIQAYNQTQKINQMIDQQENKLKQERNEIDESLRKQKSDFTELIKTIVADLDTVKNYENKRKEEEHNKKIAEINQTLHQLTEEMIKINEQEVDLDYPVSEYPMIDEYK